MNDETLSEAQAHKLRTRIRLIKALERIDEVLDNPPSSHYEKPHWADAILKAAIVVHKETYDEFGGDCEYPEDASYWAETTRRSFTEFLNEGLPKRKL